MQNINNLPKYANEYPYIVAREVDGELWFYGAYDNRNKANEIALNLGGVMVINANHTWNEMEKFLKIF